MMKSKFAVIFFILTLLACFNSNKIKVDDHHKMKFYANESLKEFIEDYSSYKNHRAFAHSESGAWGWTADRTSKENAIKMAMHYCIEANGKEDEATYPCRLLHVDNHWME